MSVALYLLAAHFAADFPLQTDTMAAKKFDRVDIRLNHTIVHGAAMFIAMTVAGYGFPTTSLFATLAMAAHFAIDSRRWVEPQDSFETFPIWYDQALHIISLAVVHAVVVQFV